MCLLHYICQYICNSDAIIEINATVTCIPLIYYYCKIQDNSGQFLADYIFYVKTKAFTIFIFSIKVKEKKKIKVASFSIK